MASKHRPMCECPADAHDRNCLFYDEWLDAPTSYGRKDLHSMSDEEFRAYCQESGLHTVHNATRTSTYGTGSYEEFWSSQRTCSHAFELFTLPTGEAMRASGYNDTPYDRFLPDVGVYLDKCWQPSDVFGYAIGWDDFGVPTMSDYDVIRTARHAYQHIQYGETVEVGCIGGHGRTGSFLAILCLVATDSNTQRTMSGKKAVEYVRDNYCKLAVENRKQERYVSKIAGMIRRGEG